jgi:hypothetical protein
MRTRPRGRCSESRGPGATRGRAAVDDYLLALEDAELADAPSLDELEAAFVLNAKHFSDCRGVSFEAGRDVGVPVDVLERAGIFEAVTV